MQKSNIVIVGAARTAIGNFGGAFRATPAHQLGATAIRAALERAGVDASQVDDVIMGQVGEVGRDAYNARRCALEAGLPPSSTAMNVNRVCGSGVQAIWSAAQSILLNHARIVVAGGDENMTMQPFLEYGARDGYRLGNRTALDGTLSLVTDPFEEYPMGATAECVAERYMASRQEQDNFALRSHQHAIAAIDSGRFRDQIVGVSVRDRSGARVVAIDEHPRRDTAIESLAALPPVFKQHGTVTAGNSSGIADAAAAVVVMSENHAREIGARPLLRFMDVAVAGIEPAVMGYAPTLAIEKLLNQARMQPTDIDILELNEAFAAQAVPVIRDTGFNPDRVNPNGGAIALGHPLGATGCVLVVKALYELKRQDAEYAMVSLCIGGGQAIAALLQNIR